MPKHKTKRRYPLTQHAGYIARIYLWLCAIFLAVLAMNNAQIIWPEHPTLLTVALFLSAIALCAMLVGAIRRGKPVGQLSRYISLRIALTVLAAVTTFFALLGLFYYISPTLFLKLASFVIPPPIQEIMLVDFLVRGGTGFWIFAIVSGILWAIRREIL